MLTLSRMTARAWLGEPREVCDQLVLPAEVSCGIPLPLLVATLSTGSGSHSRGTRHSSDGSWRRLLLLVEIQQCSVSNTGPANRLAGLVRVDLSYCDESIALGRWGRLGEGGKRIREDAVGHRLRLAKGGGFHEKCG